MPSNLVTEEYKEVLLPWNLIGRWAIGAFAIIIVSLPFAAERSVPGDGLYAVKRFNEEVRGTLAFDTVQKVEWETERLNRWLDEQYGSELQRSPLTLTAWGRKERYAEVDDFSLDAQIESIDWLRDSALEMKRRFDYERLTAQGRHSYDFWAFRSAAAEGTRPYLYHQYIFEQSSGQHTFPVQFLISYHSVDSAADMEAYIARVGGLSRGLEQWVARAREAAARGSSRIRA